MKRYKIMISEETEGGKFLGIRKRPREEYIFQVVLPEDEIDIKKVMQSIVAGKDEVRT